MKRLAVFFCVLAVACGGVDFSSSRPTSSDAGKDGATSSDGGAGGAPSTTKGTGGASGGTSHGGASGGSAGGPAGVGASGRANTGGLSASGGSSGSSTGSSSSLGGSLGSGGSRGSGGGVVDACALVTHTNGFGSTWQDCAPLGTYDKDQATRACEASGASECTATNCGAGDLIVCGYNAAQNYVYGCWGYAGSFVGRAKERSDSCSGFMASWN